MGTEYHPKATLTKCMTGWLKTIRNSFSHSSEAGSLKLRCQQGHAPSGSSREVDPSWPFPACESWCFLALDMSLQPLAWLPHVILPVCVCVQIL
jgi:hypothetical protein